jgi:hypothetical protein
MEATPRHAPADIGVPLEQVVGRTIDTTETSTFAELLIDCEEYRALGRCSSGCRRKE